MYYLCALWNKESSKLYIGQTNNLERRLFEHNEKRGNHFTAKYLGQWDLIYSEELVDRAKAIVRERELKSHRGREFLKKYIPKN